jgi:hypothetical protein
MSKITDALNTAVAAVVTRMVVLATENTTLKAQLATFADQAAALEAAAVADAAAEQDATDKLNAVLATAAPGPSAAGPPTTAELDAAAAT